MPTTNTTASRGYQLPHAGNTLAFDIARMISAFNGIDSDIAANIASIVAHNSRISALETPPALTVSQIPNLPFSKITTGLPTSLAGYGINDAVDLLGNQAIGGVKTFTSSPVAPTPAAAATTEMPNADWVRKFATPSGVIAPFAGSAAPSFWLLCYGQAVSRTTYADLFAAIGTTYGVGDGSTTFNLPDLRGREISGKDDMGGAAASRTTVTLTGTKASTSSGVITGLSSTAGLSIGMQAFGTGIGAAAVISSIDSGTQVTLSVNSTSTGSVSIRFAVVDGATLGAAGGAHVYTLSTAQIPSHTHPLTNAAGAGGNSAAGGAGYGFPAASNTSATGGGQAHPTMPPVLVLNYIIKI